MSASDLESEGAESQSEAAWLAGFCLFTPESFRFARKLRTHCTFRNSAATPDTSYWVRCGESRAMMSNCSIITYKRNDQRTLVQVRRRRWRIFLCTSEKSSQNLDF